MDLSFYPHHLLSRGELFYYLSNSATILPDKSTVERKQSLCSVCEAVTCHGEGQMGPAPAVSAGTPGCLLHPGEAGSGELRLEAEENRTYNPAFSDPLPPIWLHLPKAEQSPRRVPPAGHQVRNITVRPQQILILKAENGGGKIFGQGKQSELNSESNPYCVCSRQGSPLLHCPASLQACSEHTAYALCPTHTITPANTT